MQLTRCPHCHGRVDLAACAQDEATRELLALLARTPRPLAMALVQYLTLFRAANRDLANDRALRLAAEALDISTDPHMLAAAMGETVEAMRAKRGQGDGTPLKNHNYLRSVMRSIGERIGQAAVAETPQAPAPKYRDRDDDAAWRAQMRKLGIEPGADA